MDHDRDYCRRYRLLNHSAPSAYATHGRRAPNCIGARFFPNSKFSHGNFSKPKKCFDEQSVDEMYRN
ncbi:hypothetical protein Y032_0318g2350 [Ancylostoma ceylanicum]|uniref:Uncharacterized protein n=1 Tax=Ancylostoma ceylanicum TaxID=53326 RepID=A0A016S1Y2_9BILA|nr:hypothetical protein Y032_0318g2350 [Ancylostoma ceylanicum]